MSLATGTAADVLISHWIERQFPGLLEWVKRSGNGRDHLKAAIQYLEDHNMVPKTRKPEGVHVSRFANPHVVAGRISAND